MTLDHLTTGLRVTVGQHTSAGVKPVNEDAIGICVPEGSSRVTKGVVAVIADGVSASEAGQEASQTAVSSFLSDYYSTHDTWSVETSASKVLNALNRWLYGQGQQYASADKGYVSTFSAVVLKSASAYIFHVGDTRVYRYRHGDLEQITRDHATAVGNGQRYLSRALGIDPSLDVDFHRLELQAGDVFLLSSDGVHEWLAHRDLARTLEDSPDPLHGPVDMDIRCRQICERALANGSDDNLSVQLIYVVQPGEPEQDDLLARVRQLPFPPPLSAGHVVDGWKVVNEIQASTRSEVYLVEDQDGSRRAVLKAPSSNFEDDAAYIERFMVEEWVGSRVNSSHVVKVLKPTRPRQFLYYLTEYVAGPTLGQLLKERTRLSVVDAQNIIGQVISGLRAFHRRDVLHQDIKPDNIIYSPTGVKIIDFGSCQVAGVGEIASRVSREQKLGTRDYCAPEYLLNAPVSPKSDQFSLAVLLYELLTGQLPFGDHYRKCVDEAGFSKLRYTPSYAINPLVPVWLDGAIQRALSFDPDQRYPALSEFAQDIQRPNPAFDGSRRRRFERQRDMVGWKLFALLSILVNMILLLVMLSS
ncbi:MAG: serine/threonine protein kinase [Porticoccaceae bacterium]|nr:serine/threonine protein kinase [Porticoccaceae bacterium]